MNALVTDSKFVLLTLLNRMIRIKICVSISKQPINYKLPEMQNQIVIHPADGERDSDETMILEQIHREYFVSWYFSRISVDEAIAVLIMGPLGRN